MHDASMTTDIAQKRGIIDRESGAAIVEASRRGITQVAFQKLSPSVNLDQVHLTMFGLFSRVQGFHEAVVREIAADNPFSTLTLLRSLAEVDALLCYLIERPAELRRVSMTADKPDRFSIGSLLRAAEKESEGFQGVYQQLSGFAHPSYLGVTVGMTLSDEGHFGWQSQPSFKNENDALTAYLWLLELTEAAGALWAMLYDKVQAGRDKAKASNG